jgi:hypothetical protein
MAKLSWEDAPVGIVLWAVYGPSSFPTVFACRMRDYDYADRAIWGFSVYKRIPGFRTLGVGRDWAEKNDLHIFEGRQEAFDYIGAMFSRMDEAEKC